MTTNQQMWNDIHYNPEKPKSYLQYPADWIIRFHNMCLKKEAPTGNVLDYGCGSANNAIFFAEKGYNIYGTDVSQNCLVQIKENLEKKRMRPDLIKNFHITPIVPTKLPFQNNFFDVCISNQVFYYLKSDEQIKKVCKTISQTMKPGGIVFFTMMGPQNYYITHHTQKVNKGVYDIAITEKGHRLYGVKESIYLIRDEEHLKEVFEEFECLSIGHFDQGMFDMKSNFHWIFIGRKRK